MPGAEETEAEKAAAAAKVIADAKVKADAAVVAKRHGDAAAAALKAKSQNDKDLESMTPEEYQAEIKRLRKENADRRTTNKTLDEQKKAAEDIMGKMKQALGITDDSSSPEEIAESLKAQNSVLELELGITQLAVQNQIPHDQMEYFSFLFKKRLDGLEEGEELGEEQLTEIIAKVKATGNGGEPKKKASGIGSGGNPPPDGKGDAPTLESFVKMNTGEKSALYMKNPTLYNSLFAEANTKRML